LGVTIAVIAVFLDEERYLPTFLASLAAQVRLPDRLLLVDDGSSDASAAIAQEFAADHPWAQVLVRPRKAVGRDRLASASVWTSFQWAVGQLDRDRFDVIAKVDADLELTPHVLEDVDARMSTEPGLGLTGPYLAEPNRFGLLVRLRWRPEHVGGAIKFYRRECLDEVYPLPPLLNAVVRRCVSGGLRGPRPATRPRSRERRRAGGRRCTRGSSGASTRTRPGPARPRTSS